MRKKFSISRLLIGLLLLNLLIPAGIVGAEATPTSGKLTVHKFEREPGVEVGEEGNGQPGQTVPSDAEALPGVTFEFTQTHSYDATTDQWTAVSGNPFTRVTGDNGQIVLEDLPLGRYKVQEIDGPAHVNLNTDVYHVDIPMTNREGTDVNYDVHIYPKNETIRGAVELTKIDGQTEVALQGVVFELYNSDGTLLHEGLTTDENGKIVVTGLAYGDYYFKEVATINGYVLGSQSVAFSITESGVVFEDGTSEGTVELVQVANFVEPEVEKEVDVTAINRGETITYTITTQLPADIADYQSFVITDELDDRLAYVDGSWSVTGVDASKLTFAQNGQELSWSVNDFSALADVTEIAISFSATISEDAPANEVINNKATIEFENKHGNGGEKESNEVPVTPTAGTLIVIKQDGDTEARLAGAEFELRDTDGNVVATATTDENGQIDFGELDYGAYTLHEVKAPNGYRKLINPIEITVDEENNEQTIVVDNFESGWNLPRTGGIGTILFTSTGLALMGVALSLYVIRRRKMA